MNPAGTPATIITGDYPRFYGDTTGLAKCDLSAYLQSLVESSLTFLYNQKNIHEPQLGLRYVAYFRAVYSVVDVVVTNTFQASNTMSTSHGVKKPGDLYGQNMGEYAMFYPDYSSPVIEHPRGKFLNKFEKPVYFDGYPFSLGFYYPYMGYYIALRETYDNGDTLRDVTRIISSTYKSYVNSVKLDESHNATDVLSSAQLIIFQSSQSVVSTSNNAGNTDVTFDQQVTFQVGDSIHIYIPSLDIDNTYEVLSTSTDGFADTTTVEIDEPFVSTADYTGARVYYNEQTMSESLDVEIDQTCYDNPIYLRFLNSAGYYSYWLFHTMQEYVDDTSKEELFEPYVEDLETAETNIEVMSKEVQESIEIGAEHLTFQQATALRDLARSVHVQMYNGLDENDLPKWLTVRVQTGSFMIKQTDETRSSIKLTIYPPKSVNQQN